MLSPMEESVLACIGVTAWICSVLVDKNGLEGLLMHSFEVRNGVQSRDFDEIHEDIERDESDGRKVRTVRWVLTLQDRE